MFLIQQRGVEQVFYFGGFGNVFMGTVAIDVGHYLGHKALNVFNKRVGREDLSEVVKSAANVDILLP